VHSGVVVVVVKKRARQLAAKRAYNAANRERRTAYNRAYYTVNRERLKARRRAYYTANSERVKAYQRAYYTANREYYTGYNRAYYHANRARRRAQHRAWYERNKDTCRRGTTQYYRQLVIAVLIERDGAACFVCQRPVDAAEASVEHRLPLAAGGDKFAAANLAVSHRSCNSTRPWAPRFHGQPERDVRWRKNGGSRAR
jgi:hypothetical protein